MKIIPVEKLYDYDYSVSVINGLKQYWDVHNTFSCMGNPKNVNMLLYLDNAKAHYISSSGNEIYAESGDIIYTPIGCEYSVRFYDFKRPEGNTVGVNLHFADQNGEAFRLSDGIRVFKDHDKQLRTLFSKITMTCKSVSPSPGIMKAAMYEIISSISRSCRAESFDEKKYRIIEKGIQYLENDTEQSLSISEIAALCSVSEIYFRKLFKKYAGISPAKYRMTRKIEQSKLLLEYEPLSISEISDILGFTDAAYFAKVFKEMVGVSPKEFRIK